MAKEFDIPKVVPWGRRLKDYAAYFDLRDVDLNGTRSILDVAAGPSSFAAEATAQGAKIVACDPVYALDGPSIAAEFESNRQSMLEGMTRARHRMNWAHYGSPEGVVASRRSALDLFVADYETGRAAGRYVEGKLPGLPFGDQSFDLALCSHMLFLYSHVLDAPFHIEAVKGLLRVAGEVRIYPLMDLDGNLSVHLEPVIEALRQQGLDPKISPVPFEFQKGATNMLRVFAINRADAA